MKQKNASLRRNILFDNKNQDLKMNFTVDFVTWKTVVPSKARSSLMSCRPTKTRQMSMAGQELDDLLGR